MNGPVWVPPPLPVFDRKKAKAKRNSGDLEMENNSENKDLDYFKAVGRNKERIEGEEEIMRLPYQLKREYISILVALSVKQTDVCNAMIFVMENTEYYKPIIRVLCEKISESKEYEQL